MAFWGTSVQSSDNIETESNGLLTQPFPTRRLSQCVTSHKFHRLFCCRFWSSWWGPSDLWLKKQTDARFMLPQLHVRFLTGFVVVAWNHSCKKKDEGRLISRRMSQGVQHRTVQKVNKHMMPLLTLSCTHNSGHNYRLALKICHVMDQAQDQFSILSLSPYISLKAGVTYGVEIKEHFYKNGQETKMQLSVSWGRKSSQIKECEVSWTWEGPKDLYP